MEARTAAQIDAAESQHAGVRSRGQEESLAAINSLKASYDVSLARLRESHDGEVAALQMRHDRAMQQCAANEAALAEARREVAALRVRVNVLPPCLCGALCGADWFVIAGHRLTVEPAAGPATEPGRSNQRR